MHITELFHTVTGHVVSLHIDPDTQQGCLAVQDHVGQFTCRALATAELSEVRALIDNARSTADGTELLPVDLADLLPAALTG